MFFQVWSTETVFLEDQTWRRMKCASSFNNWWQKQKNGKQSRWSSSDMVESERQLFYIPSIKSWILLYRYIYQFAILSSYISFFCLLLRIVQFKALVELIAAHYTCQEEKLQSGTLRVNRNILRPTNSSFHLRYGDFQTPESRFQIPFVHMRGWDSSNSKQTKKYKTSRSRRNFLHIFGYARLYVHKLSQLHLDNNYIS